MPILSLWRLLTLETTRIKSCLVCEAGSHSIKNIVVVHHKGHGFLVRFLIGRKKGE